jgi:1,4-dihydroxy-6-naphthoate synthase
MATTEIRLGISTCPNDTFAFHGLMERLVDWRGLRFSVELLDIQQLNKGLREGRFDVAKASFFAALSMADQLVVLPSGSALGYGVGPLLLANRAGQAPAHAGQCTLCPGQDTTAALLFQLFYPQTSVIRHVVFSDIMPMLQLGGADFGVCIHEGRFTWQAAGLHLVEDLGSRWERETQCPLPLGGILAARRLGDDVIGRVQATIRDSLALAQNDPAIALPSMQKYAQEFNDQVLMQHVELYVNAWTEDLGEIGANAIAELNRRARQVGLLRQDAADLRVWQACVGL